jgi:hypothetical protein
MLQEHNLQQIMIPLSLVPALEAQIIHRQHLKYPGGPCHLSAQHSTASSRSRSPSYQLSSRDAYVLVTMYAAWACKIDYRPLE